MFFIKGRNYHLFEKAHSSSFYTIHEIVSYDSKYTFSSVECPALEAFEKRKYMYEKTLSNTERFIEVPRYDLTFEVKKGILYWQQKPSFFVVNNNLPQGILAVQKQCLLLENSSKEKLLLVPRFNTRADQGFSREAILQPADTPINWSHPLKKESYSCYKISSDNTEQKIVLKPLTLGAKLDLAYYRMHERKYDESIRLFKSVSPFNLYRISSENIVLLKKIISFGSPQKNQAPEVSACILRAGLLLYDAEKFNDPTYTFSTPISEELSAACRHYLSKKNHIAISHRLIDEELKIYNNLLNGIFTNYLYRSPSAGIHMPIYDISICLNSRLSVSTFDWRFIRSSLSFDKNLSLPYRLQRDGDFWYVYEAIRLEKYSLQRIESYLLCQIAKSGSSGYTNLGLLCVAAVAHWKSSLIDHKLPEIPDLQAIYEAEDLNAEISKEKENEFKRELKYLLSDIKYVLRQPTTSVPESIVEEFTKDKKKRVPGDYYESKSKPITSKPLFQQLEMKSVHVKPQCLSKLEIYKGKERGNHSWYRGSIQRELLSVNKEIAQGKKRLENYSELATKGRDWFKSFQDLQDKLNGKINALTISVQEKKEGILEALKLQQSNDLLTRDQLKQIAGITIPLTIEDLEYIVLWGDQEPEFLRIACIRCPQLREKKIQQGIWEQLLAYEVDAVYLLVYKKALSAYERMESAKTDNERNFYAAELALALENNLQEFTVHPSISQLHMLIFSRRSKIFPRKDQIEDIHTLIENDSSILQKIMGGGKTSVIAALWAFREARYTNNLPVIFAEGSLYQLLGDSLTKSQYTIFGQHIFAIDPPKTNLNLKMIETIYKQLEEGHKKHWVLVMKAETLQAFDLELQKLILEGGNAAKEKQKGLRRILNLF
ncbi:MAG: hypothetical protein P0S93_03695 [Candidatus Neptunochlamydia sp.]|nr:hypothetical protein [Candidatus Neptunochlamydia sp.]